MNYKLVHIDFETRATVNIGDTGAWRYAEHPDTRILCLAYALGEGQVKLYSKEDFESFNTDLSELRALVNDPNTIFIAHNAFFEQAIWANIMVKEYAMPELPIRRWRCSAAKAAAAGLPRSLGSVSITLGLPYIKSLEGRKVMLKLSKPKGDGSWENDPLLFNQLYDYCQSDVEAERSLDKALPDLSEQEQIVWFLDQRINMRGVLVDTKAIDEALNIAEEVENNLSKELLAETDGEIDSVSKHLALKRYLNKIGVPVTSVSKEAINEVMAKGKLTDKAKRILRLKQELGRSSLAKYRAFKRSTCKDGRIRDILLYHGASTGRWSGKLVQLQNLPSRGLKADGNAIAQALSIGDNKRVLAESSVTGALSAAIRGMIIPSPGYKLIVADYSAIEARVVMWMAEEITGMEMFRISDSGEGEDVYVQMAQRLYKNPSLTKADKDERSLGKQTILGCGYNMGAAKFYDTCKEYGLKVSEDMAQKTVSFYRSTFPKVPEIWRLMEQAAITAVVRGQRVRCSKMVWEKKGDWLSCTLPSGRNNRYYKPEVDIAGKTYGTRRRLTYMTQSTQNKSFIRKETYGGLLFENVCQAIARDIMALAMVRVEREGYRCLFTVHDEIIAEHPKPNIKVFCDILTEKSSWNTGLPLKAEGFISERYRKD